eukprot:4776419-Amphidinium_carterae.1
MRHREICTMLLLKRKYLEEFHPLLSHLGAAVTAKGADPTDGEDPADDEEQEALKDLTVFLSHPGLCSMHDRARSAMEMALFADEDEAEEDAVADASTEEDEHVKALFDNRVAIVHRSGAALRDISPRCAHLLLV